MRSHMKRVFWAGSGSGSTSSCTFPSAGPSRGLAVCTTLPESCRLAKVPVGEPVEGNPDGSGLMGAPVGRAARCGVIVLSMPDCSRCAVSLVKVDIGRDARDAWSVDGAFALAADLPLEQRASSCGSVSTDIFMLPSGSVTHSSSHLVCSSSADRPYVRQRCDSFWRSAGSLTSANAACTSLSDASIAGSGERASDAVGARTRAAISFGRRRCECFRASHRHLCTTRLRGSACVR